MKEIAHRIEFKDAEDDEFMDLGLVSYDFCNDFSVLLEIILDRLLDQTNKQQFLIFIHAPAEYLKNLQAILVPFNDPGNIYPLGFITDVKNLDIAIYSTTQMAVYKEENNWFYLLDDISETRTREVFQLVLCYLDNNICQWFTCSQWWVNI